MKIKFGPNFLVHQALKMDKGDLIKIAQGDQCDSTFYCADFNRIKILSIHQRAFNCTSYTGFSINDQWEHKRDGNLIYQLFYVVRSLEIH